MSNNDHGHRANAPSGQPSPHATVSLAHGSGGRLTRDLVRAVFGPRLSNPRLTEWGDSARLQQGGERLAFTTDAFVVHPLVFPGGDIGKLAVCGTVNDLSVAGAVPRFLSLAVILEEGLDVHLLEQIADSIAEAAAAAGVEIVTGDTKVVEKGKGDGMYITTAGVGALRDVEPPRPTAVKPGDVVLTSGPLGDHGAVIMSLRSGIDLSSNLTSDCAPVVRLADALYGAGVRVRFMRDPTRGGAAAVFAELAEESGLGLEVEEACLPFRPEVRGIAELLGLDPLTFACEGRLIAVVEEPSAEQALAALHALPEGREACRIGRIVKDHPGQAVMVTRYGSRRLIELPIAEQLPRIC